MLELWARILHSTPNSTLLIKAKALASQTVEQHIRQIMESVGIAKDRLHLQPWRKSHEQHLASYQTVDIILDTFPYHGTTTTAEALWMGVPVVTLAGTTHVSRVGVSMLTNIGLPELIAHSENQYIQIATDLAKDIPRRNQSPLNPAPADAAIPPHGRPALRPQLRIRISPDVAFMGKIQPALLVPERQCPNSRLNKPFNSPFNTTSPGNFHRRKISTNKFSPSDQSTFKRYSIWAYLPVSRAGTTSRSI